jgi:hypothetical protein
MDSSSEEIFSITNAQKGLAEDQSARQRKYLFSMIIRTVCFLLTLVLPNPYRWYTLAGAVFLPYIAVIIANAGRESVRKPQSLRAPKRQAISNNED